MTATSERSSSGRCARRTAQLGPVGAARVGQLQLGPVMRVSNSSTDPETRQRGMRAGERLEVSTALNSLRKTKGRKGLWNGGAAFGPRTRAPMRHGRKAGPWSAPERLHSGSGNHPRRQYSGSATRRPGVANPRQRGQASAERAEGAYEVNRRAQPKRTQSTPRVNAWARVAWR